MASGSRRLAIDTAIVASGGIKNIEEWVETGVDLRHSPKVRLDPGLEAAVERHRAAQRKAGRFVMPEELDQYAPTQAPQINAE